MRLWLLAACSSVDPGSPVHLGLPVAGDTVRFAAIGDVGKDNDGQRRVAAALANVCRERGCDFVLLLGDNLYPTGMDHPQDPRMDRVFTEMYRDTPAPFAAVLGNHDWGASVYRDKGAHQLSWATQQDRFLLPSRYWSFDAGPATFWALDTDSIFWDGSIGQGDWLTRGMATSDSRWRIVFGHHPYRSDGPHGNAGTYDGWSSVPYVSGVALRRFFDTHVAPQADLYLAGHDHSLQSLVHEGLPLVVSGAGATTTPVFDHGNTPTFRTDELGFAWIELGDAIDLTFFGDDGRTLHHEVISRRAARSVADRP